MFQMYSIGTPYCAIIYFIYNFCNKNNTCIIDDIAVSCYNYVVR
jgi:hypothetical protein